MATPVDLSRKTALAAAEADSKVNALLVAAQARAKNGDARAEALVARIAAVADELTEILTAAEELTAADQVDADDAMERRPYARRAEAA